MLMILCASLMWASYALAQKTLLKRWTSPQVLCLMYLGAVAIVFPFAGIGEIRSLDTRGAWVLAFCCANTLAGYGSFAEALDHWEVSRVSAVLALSPIFTFAGMRVMAYLSPGFVALESFSWPTLAGALVVVSGSALSAFATGERGEVTVE